MKFFQNLEMKLSKIYFKKKKKKFFESIFLRISSPDFGNPQKIHDFIF